LLQQNSLNSGITKELVESYVAALNIRKEAHTMGAIFSGRHPIQNAIVPGGVSTLYNQDDIDLFRDKLNTVRNFINKYYIPDVVFVATRSSVGTGENWATYWTVGTSPGLALSYGEYPLAGGEAPFKVVNNADMLLDRGLARYTGSGSAPTFVAFNIAKIKEYVEYSYYSSPSGLHPSAGATTPNVNLVSHPTNGQYSWLKSPRYNGEAAEVGPLARMVVTYLNSGTKTASEAATTGVVAPCTILGLGGGSYTVTNLVGNALGGINTVAFGGGTTVTAAQLFSPLGRHACRALETKLLADKMDTWLSELTLQHLAGTSGIPNNPSGSANYTTGVDTGSGYVYAEIPKANVYGAGLAEAPRGALGHWITIQSKKIANYQCVVPSTWNCGPRSTSTMLGPAESVLIGLQPSVSGNTNDMIVNIARMLHPYDFCIACAVHVVTPDGKDIAKFEMGLDGKIKKL